MEALMTYSQAFFGWLLQTTLIASLVICLILLIQKLLSGRLGPRWSYALWLVLLVRMILPWSPSSRVSLSNLIPSWQRQTHIQKSSGTIKVQEISPPEQAAESSEAITKREAGPETTAQEQAAPRPRTLDNAKAQSGLRLVLLRQILPILWLAVAIVIGMYLLLSDLALWRIVKRDRPLINQAMLVLFEECKAQMGVQSLVVVVPSDKVRSPGLFGFVRPRLLLPRQMLDNATAEEMRYVFLHELAHLRRHDIYLGWLTSLLQVLHWFNPLVWFAFYRMRADRELACDALVLTRMGQDKSQEYGGAIVELVRRFSRSRPLPAMAGIIESKSQLKRRIAMITKFRNKSYRFSPLAVIFIVILASVSLPDAISMQTSEISTKESAPHISMRRVWAGSDVAVEGEVSPDGKYISYTDWDTGDLAVYEVATGQKRRITNKGIWDESDEFAEFSRWSPDSKQIVYDWYNKDRFIELRIIGLDGSEPRILYRNKNVTWAQTYDWSHDGKQILACFTTKGRDQIVSVSVADGSARFLKTINNDYLQMVFSPDGRYIVYDFPQKESSTESDIFLLSADGSGEIPLVEHPADDRILDWTPDGKNILFTSDRTGSLCMWSIAIADGRVQGIPKLIRKDIGQKFTSMGFTKEGSFYYGYGGGGGFDVYTTKLNLQTGKVLSPPKKAILRFEGHNATPDYSPDGKYIAYVSHRGSRNQILCIRSLETGQEQEFPSKLMRMTDPKWSPDGNSILIAGMDYNINRYGNYQVDPKTGIFTPILLPSKDFRFNSHEWSHDGESYFLGRSSVKNKHSQIMLREIKSGKEKEIYHLPRLERFSLACSPDGKWLAFINMRNESALRIIPSDGGESRELYRCESKKEQLMTCKWTPNGKYILFVKRKIEQKESSLWRIPVEGGEAQKIDLGINIGGLSIHPDGQHITFGTRENQPAEVWVMKNFLPGMPVAKPMTKPKFTKIHVPTKLPFRGSGILSPDGQKLAFISGGSVWVLPVHGKSSTEISGTPVRLTEPMHAWDIANVSIAWSGNGKWIGFRVAVPKQDKNAEEELYIIPAEGGTPKRVPITWKDWAINVHTLRYALSPNGETLYFTDGPKLEQTRIYSMSTNGGEKQQITEPITLYPVVSPDGSKIAYVRTNLGPNDVPLMQELWVKPLNGGESVLACKATGKTWFNSPVWSPDSNKIAFLSSADKGGGRFCQIWIVALSSDGIPGAPAKFELPKQTSNLLAGWTQDNKIGVLVPSEQEVALFTVLAKGGKATQLTTAYTCMPVWAPDGRHIYFDGCHGGKLARLEYVASEGGKINRIPFLPENLSPSFPSDMAISNDGSTLLFAGFYRYGESKPEGSIFTVPVEGGMVTPLRIDNAEKIHSVGSPKWSPDENRVAFIAAEKIKPGLSVYNIFVVPAEGGEAKSISSQEDHLARGTIDWSPDGKLIAFYGDNALRVISSDGGMFRILVSDIGGGIPWAGIAWSPDGKQVAYTAGGDLHVVSRDGGQPKIIKTDLDARHLKIDWSRDGRQIAFTASRGGDPELWLMENFLPEAMAMGK
jgi:Tol biopolymer transport system component/beta-lactamase regulating signal transducer with metallopeptidase domain